MAFCARLLLSQAAIWLLAAAACAQRSTEVSTAFVYMPDGTVHCDATRGTPLDSMAQQLIRGGVQVYSRFGSYDGREGVAVCGAPTGGINVYEIAESDLPKASKLGFRRLDPSRVTPPSATP